MINRFVQFFSSLRLAFVCLGLALILVFAGTMAQVRMGLYEVQSQFFHSFLIYWTPHGTHFKIPIFPGGWLVGWLLMVNLLTAQITRFSFTRKKIGILVVHAGLIFLLAGQFFTEIFQVESQMRLEPGRPMNYTEDSRRTELAVIDVTDPNHDSVVSIPEALLAKGGDIRVPGLPFALHVEKYLPNSLPAGPMSGPGEKLKARNGTGQRLLFTAAPKATRMDDENKPAALVEITTDKGSVGDWTVSTWLTKRPWVGALQGEVGDLLNVPVDAPQTFTCAGHNYQLALRAVRYYLQYTITLREFRHDVYPGTDIPSNFSSTIHLTDPSRGEDRDVLIRMNSPLRYRGESFYQASFEPGDQVSILQAVRNPASLTPYVACSLIGLGLVIQFLSHLFVFAKSRAKQADAAPKPDKAGATALAATINPALRTQR